MPSWTALPSPSNCSISRPLESPWFFVPGGNSNSNHNSKDYSAGNPNSHSNMLSRGIIYRGSEPLVPPPSLLGAGYLSSAEEFMNSGVFLLGSPEDLPFRLGAVSSKEHPNVQKPLSFSVAPSTSSMGACITRAYYFQSILGPLITFQTPISLGHSLPNSELTSSQHGSLSGHEHEPWKTLSATTIHTRFV